MRPLKLTMQAFGSYGEETTVDFAKPDQNLFLITGDTGAGKTTIFDAIVFRAVRGSQFLSQQKRGNPSSEPVYGLWQGTFCGACFFRRGRRDLYRPQDAPASETDHQGSGQRNRKNPGGLRFCFAYHA